MESFTSEPSLKSQALLNSAPRHSKMRDAFNKARTVVKPWLVPSIRLSGYAKISRKLAKHGWYRWISISVSDRKPIVIK